MKKGLIIPEIIKIGFCDIRNHQDLGKDISLISTSTKNIYLDHDNSEHHKTLN